ncbi:hypothetical protein [Enterocloster clostridioformis]|uniref:hypothetical protein n=1 Tax=Enterocloster clostridioformis TaxID=1531 RepID=UPI0011062912|nr:hypothetical protein [Enterocloster clostridioformis]
MNDELLWMQELADLNKIDSETYQMILNREKVNSDEFYRIVFTVLEHGFCNLFIELIKQHQNLIDNDKYQEIVDKAYIIEGNETPCEVIYAILKKIGRNK